MELSSLQSYGESQLIINNNNMSNQPKLIKTRCLRFH